MRISKIHIKNLKSLKDVTLNGMRNVVVLIGRNSSGKSNLLEAIYMFFSFFNLIEPTPLSPYNEVDSNIWYDTERKNPIEITLSFRFDAVECDEIFPSEALNIVKEGFPNLYTQLVVCRKIIDVKKGWKTEYVNWAEIPLIRDNKLVSPEEFCKSLTVSHIEPESTPPFPESNAAKILGKVARNLQAKIKGKFSLAKITRDSAERPLNLHMRTPTVNAETCEMLRYLKKSRKRDDIVRSSYVEDMFEDTSSMKMDIREGEIFVRKHDLSLPIHLIGGGDQEALILENFLTRRDSILAIEEVEMHFHRRLLIHIIKLIKMISGNSQIFLTTHSPTVIDRVDIRNIWIARMQGKETKFIGFSEADNMKNMLSELDVPISNILYADKILLVEGVLEKAMLPIFAKKMEIDPDSFSIIQITPKPGKTDRPFKFFGREESMDYKLGIWSEVSKKVKIPLFLLLHKEAEKEVKDLIQDNSLQDWNYAILSERIENYIPVTLLVSILNENYGLNLTIEEINAYESRMVEVKRILRNFKELHFGWKNFIAVKVAEKMTKKTIPNEIKKLFAKMQLP